MINAVALRVLAGSGWRHRLTAPLARALKKVINRGAQVLRVRQSQGRLERAAQRHWNRYWDHDGRPRATNDGHWRGRGPFVDDARWLNIGRRTSRRYSQMTAAIGFPDHVDRIVEWGVGGGANAIHFARLCDSFTGVDVAQASLDESARQMEAEGLDNFEPVLIDVSDPEAATQVIDVCDVFLCLYVFELLPTPSYGERILRVAFDLLRPGGVAFIQIRYQTDSPLTRAKGFAYSLNMVNMTTYRLDDLWRIATECGFEPQLIKLVPWDPVVEDERYAYYLLRKPSGTSGGPDTSAGA